MAVAGERVEDGQVEGERLARGGARRDDDVAAALRRCVRLAPGARRARRCLGARAHRARPGGARPARGGPRAARGLGREVRELVAHEEVVPDGGRGHRPLKPHRARPRERFARPRCRSRSAPAGATTASNLPAGRVRDRAVARASARARKAGSGSTTTTSQPASSSGGCVDAGEAELEHAARPFAQQLEDLRRRGSGEGRRKPMHRVRSIHERRGATASSSAFRTTGGGRRGSGTGRARGTPNDRRIVMPRAFGWGYDLNVAEVARRLGLRH